MWRLAAGGASSTSASACIPRRPLLGLVRGWRRATSIENITLSESEGQEERAQCRRYARRRDQVRADREPVQIRAIGPGVRAAVTAWLGGGK